MTRLLAIVPAYNEAGAIAGTVADILERAAPCDVVVVDDGSTDATSELARAAGATVIRLPFNLGIGGAVQTGYQYALEQGYDNAIQVDGDGQHDAGYIRELRARRSGPNGVFGLKLHSHQMRNLDALDSLLPGAGYVRLRRRDIDAQAVSLWTALQTRQFYSETETGLWTRYEALVNLVFASSPASLLCAYDTRTIAPEVARQARLTHPHTIGPQGVESSSDYGDPGGYVLGA